MKGKRNRILRANPTLSSLLLSLLICSTIIYASNAFAARISDIGKTKHNFSADPSFTPPLPTGENRIVIAVSETQICVFCHTPHAATKNVPPMWSRQMPVSTYSSYDSSSMDSSALATTISQPNATSKLCLSCHDGTLAVGSVNVVNSRFTDGLGDTEDIPMTGTFSGFIARGEGEKTGFTSNLGTDLRNDHPISVRYDSLLALKDGELREPMKENHLVINLPGVANSKTSIPLEQDSATITGGSVECNSCHDPHIRDTSNENIKFLRLNRLQKVAPINSAFSVDNDIICLGCHDKAGWVGSAHANASVADELYSVNAAKVRDFPRGTKVWQAACISCHDAHTVTGSRRLLREGVDGTVVTSSTGIQVKTGDGLAAIEETCYLCHSGDTNTLQGQLRARNDNVFEVPNIKYDYVNSLRHEPISNDDQMSSTEVHNIGTYDIIDPLLISGYGNEGKNGLGKDFIEKSSLLGRGSASPINRHAECTDCHNPHRVTKNRFMYDDPNTPDQAGTHLHGPSHSNIASGVLRGSWGLEPDYAFNTAFGSDPIGFTIKRGNPSQTIVSPQSDPNNFPYVTREYQICMKCHSNFAYGNTPPNLGYYIGGTPSGTNGLTRYTNQAMEFQAPFDHVGEVEATTPTGAGVNYLRKNHRSWHPVMRATGRTTFARSAESGVFLPPFDADMDIGTQTMYCSDCHGSDTANETVVPNGGENGAAWGPHGSNNDFILKGPSTGDTGSGRRGDLCFKCHSYDQYANTLTAQSGIVKKSGFACLQAGGSCISNPSLGRSAGNLHVFHASVVTNFRCNLCHAAVPHGWKNKAFLVNLNDVGPEAGLQEGTEVRNNIQAKFTREPYYNGAVLKINTFASSGSWVAADCGSSGTSTSVTNGNGALGLTWMRDSSEACVNLP